MRLKSKECITNRQCKSRRRDIVYLEVSIHVESKYDSLFWMRYKIMVELNQYFKVPPVNLKLLTNC